MRYENSESNRGGERYTSPCLISKYLSNIFLAPPLLNSVHEKNSNTHATHHSDRFYLEGLIILTVRILDREQNSGPGNQLKVFDFFSQRLTESDWLVRGLVDFSRVE